MSGTDLRVRPRLTFAVTSYTSGGCANKSAPIVDGLTANAAKVIAEAMHRSAENPRHMTYFDVTESSHDLYAGTAPEWLNNADAALAGAGEGSFFLVEKQQNQSIRVTRGTARTYTGLPTQAGADHKGFKIDASGFRVESTVETVETIVSHLKDGVMREIGRINLPERWEDLSRETSKRGLEAFMAIQTAGKEVWRDHEIEGLIEAIHKQTGKAKHDLRVMFERAQEQVRRAAEAVGALDGSLPVPGREEHYCKNRAKGLSPAEAARYAGYANPYQASATLLEANGRIQRRIAFLSSAPVREEYAETERRRAGPTDAPAVFQVGEKTWKVPADQMPPKGSLRLDNATQEFFALNIGFYGMTIDAAAKQMSLPLPTADGLMEMPTVRDRIKFFQRLLSPLA